MPTTWNITLAILLMLTSSHRDQYHKVEFELCLWLGDVRIFLLELSRIAAILAPQGYLSADDLGCHGFGGRGR